MNSLEQNNQDFNQGPFTIIKNCRKTSTRSHQHSSKGDKSRKSSFNDPIKKKKKDRKYTVNYKSQNKIQEQQQQVRQAYSEHHPEFDPIDKFLNLDQRLQEFQNYGDQQMIDQRLENIIPIYFKQKQLDQQNPFLSDHNPQKHFFDENQHFQHQQFQWNGLQKRNFEWAQ